ncbi:hypothetical protein M436DRAFT_64315 [Aureobasidium namibiae CBS 147.97]|uniref:Uncharacterized protein n=1 Tax=Aureobasidium namibiae CBS 147.97 TaxID=1043004 RepID=A0A074WL13_9PEZI
MFAFIALRHASTTTMFVIALGQALFSYLLACLSSIAGPQRVKRWFSIRIREAEIQSLKLPLILSAATTANVRSSGTRPKPTLGSVCSLHSLDSKRTPKYDNGVNDRLKRGVSSNPLDYCVQGIAWTHRVERYFKTRLREMEKISSDGQQQAMVGLG